MDTNVLIFLAWSKFIMFETLVLATQICLACTMYICMYVCREAVPQMGRKPSLTLIGMRGDTFISLSFLKQILSAEF